MPSHSPSPRLLTRPVLAWALYDLANTIFSMNIVSLYMSLWVIRVMGGTDAVWGYANSLSQLLVLFTAPVLGALSDRAGRRLPFLLASTLACVVLTALLGLGGLDVSLAVYVAAFYCFSAGLVFYDALLPSVSTPETRGRVGGLGIGLGYVGSFIGIAVGLMTLERFGHVFVFRATAALLLLFSIPIFLFVREGAKSGARIGWRAIGQAFGQVRRTLAQARQHPGLVRFLVGRALYADAANTIIVFMGIYVTTEVGYTDREAQVLLLVAITAAVLGGLATGRVVDRIGPKRALDIALFVWMVTFAGAIAVAVLDLPKATFMAVACLAGVGLGATWTADRPYLLRLAPPDRVGEFFGLYALVGRFAAVVGPALWAFTSSTLGLGRPAAVATLLVLVVVAYVVLRGVDDGWGEARG